MIPSSALATISALGLSPDQAAGVAHAMAEIEQATAEAVAAPLEQKLGIKRAKSAGYKREERSRLMKRLANIEAAVVPSQSEEVAG